VRDYHGTDLEGIRSPLWTKSGSEDRNRSAVEGSLLKLVALIVFLLAFYVTVVWQSAVERGLSPPQQSAAGGAAIVGWILTFSLAAMA
jgi:uncharacterized membrane protein